MQDEKSLRHFQHAMSFIEEVKHINTIEGLVNIFTKYIKPLGFDQFSCASFCDVKNPPNNAVMILQYPAKWLEHYMEEKYERFDRILAVSLNRSTPFTWQEPIIKKNCTKKQKEIFDGAKHVGLIHGITVPVHSHGFHPACVNVVGPNIDIDPSAEHALHLMCIYLYEGAVRIQRATPTLNHHRIVSLTNRERECLQWVAEGKSESCIADILNISQRTIHFHIENVKNKYNVSTRTQAVARALAEQQIIPQ